VTAEHVTPRSETGAFAKHGGDCVGYVAHIDQRISPGAERPTFFFGISMTLLTFTEAGVVRTVNAGGIYRDHGNALALKLAREAFTFGF
jgi:hypothetical protein